MSVEKIKKDVIRILTLPIPVKKWRKGVRSYLNGVGNGKGRGEIAIGALGDEEFEREYGRARFGVSYSVWDGEELLESSIKQIRKYVDYINVVWQEKSWSGTPNPTLKAELDRLVANGLVDELIEYKSLCDGSYQEPTKRQLGLDAAIKAGCNYFMVMDTDEFYIGEEFENAKKFVVKNRITRSFIMQKWYGFSPLEQTITPEHASCSVTFMCKIDEKTRIDPDNGLYPYTCDVSRKISSTKDDKFFFVLGISMHHMCILRKDIVKKISESSARDIYRKEIFGESCGGGVNYLLKTA